ncbi:MAG: SURF1 family protein [Alphaproteobacteria bacterium]|nr:SURF1 family protein [Alphaproteobacteria bacterium]MBV8548508.1 SURF1 family protein [Alphaproteobacteria bacterium]
MISFRILGGQFSLHWLRLLLTIFFVVLCGFLGAWQMQRLQEKTDLLQLIAERTVQPYTDLSVLRIGNDIDYMRVAASGRFNHDNEMYMTAISKAGEGGYDVLTPMLMEDGRWVLVNRGWIPYKNKDPLTRLQGQVQGMVRIHGTLRLPQKTWLMHGHDQLSGVWRGVDLDAMARENNIPGFLPFIVELDDTPNPGGLPVGGQTRFDLPNNHFGYAMTWYGLAFIALFVFLVSSWEKLPTPPDAEAPGNVRRFVPKNPKSSPTKDDPPTRRQS